jgi:glucose-6-phosphate isomerase
LFAADAKRGETLRICWEDFYVDYSKNLMTDETLALLLELAEECQLKEAMENYFGGDVINATEGRAVLHTALRAPSPADVRVHGENIIPEVHAVIEKIQSFSQGVIDGTRTSSTGQAFTDVVNIGIGGSDLGPVMITEALEHYKNHLRLHFISNVDGDHVMEVLKKVNPETTLFVVVSKSFTTQETLTNASTAKAWLVDALGDNAVADHFVAVSTNLPMINSFGINPDNVFPMNDWVGGRFSLWSAVGLSIALSVGPDHFSELLEGAHEMDTHFASTPLDKNIPVVLALLTLWYNNFHGAESEAISPSPQYLHRLPAYLQQGIMESNGKSVDRAGRPVNYQTGNLIQHAFFQHIHQGTKLIPADFIGFKTSLYGEEDHQHKLMANFIAQTEALMRGKSMAEAVNELTEKGLSEDEIETLAPFKVFEGNNPTNTLLIDQLTPRSLGKLVAMYENKIFVEGVLWNIYSYDQWGVELGKQLASTILEEVVNKNAVAHDSSTSSLLRYYQS